MSNFIRDFMDYSRSQDFGSVADIRHINRFNQEYSNTGIFIRKVGTKIPTFLYNVYMGTTDTNLEYIKQINISPANSRYYTLTRFINSNKDFYSKHCLELIYRKLEDYDRKIYYGPGIILDEDFNVILLHVYNIDINDLEPFKVNRNCLYITSNIFKEQKDKLYKKILKGLDEFKTLDVPEYYSNIEIIVDDERSNNFILKPNSPTDNNINVSLNTILRNNITFITENLCSYYFE